MKKVGFNLSVVVLMGLAVSCISDEENIEANFEQEKKKIEDFIESLDNEDYLRKETIGSTGIVLLFSEVAEEGLVPTERDTLRVDYKGFLLDGTVFDTSVEQVAHDHNMHNPNREYQPYAIILGVSQEIVGWHVALANMKEGEKAIAFIPSVYAYGVRGQGPIPPNTVLAFDLDLLEVAPSE